MYEGSTEENGEILKCNICLDELEIGAEVCRLPCGHLNCKTCIEGWFDIRTENSDENSFQTLDENKNDTQNNNSDVEYFSDVSNENSDLKEAVYSEFPKSEVQDLDILDLELPVLNSEPPTLEENELFSNVYWNE